LLDFTEYSTPIDRLKLNTLINELLQVSENSNGLHVFDALIEIAWKKSPQTGIPNKNLK